MRSLASAEAWWRRSCTSAGSGSGPKIRFRSVWATTAMSPKLATTVAFAALTILDNQLLPVAAGNDDLAALFQQPDDCDHALLRLLDRLEADRPHELHVFPQHVARAVGHVLEDAGLDVFADALEREPEVLYLHLPQDLLN